MKVLSLDVLARIAEECRLAGKKVVHAHGCYEFIHPGHVRHLQNAKSFGDVLIVSVTADEHVNKGPGRPIFQAALRAEALAALACVDYACISVLPTASQVISHLRPDIYVKGPECREKKTIGLLQEIAAVELSGGQIAYTSDIVFSSTEIIRKILKE